MGCADGYFTIEAARRGYKSVLGLDVRTANVERAKYAAELFGLPNVSFAVDNIYELGTVRGRTFDVVICQGVMYHLANPILALQNLRALTGTVAFIAGWTAIGDGAKFDLRTDDVDFFLDRDPGDRLHSHL
jgi:tRNA (mo5U34)-methyltransferase